MNSTLTQWDRKAARLANQIDRTVDRGVLGNEDNSDVLCVYGCDGLLDDLITQREVSLFREWLCDQALCELGIGTSDDGIVWVMIVRVDGMDPRGVNVMLWSCWDEAGDEKIEAVGAR